MTHQARQVCHGVMVALPLPGTSAVRSQTSDVCGVYGVYRVCGLA
jgi:hypothetical protein